MAGSVGSAAQSHPPAPDAKRVHGGERCHASLKGLGRIVTYEVCRCGHGGNLVTRVIQLTLPMGGGLPSARMAVLWVASRRCNLPFRKTTSFVVEIVQKVQ